MRRFLNMGCQIPPFMARFCIGLLLVILGMWLGFGAASAADPETQQVVKITGSVSDSETREPLAGVTVRKSLSRLNRKHSTTLRLPLSGMPCLTRLFRTDKTEPVYDLNSQLSLNWQISG